MQHTQFKIKGVFIMKKMVSILMVITMLVTFSFALTGCGSTSEKTKIGVVMYGYTDEQGKSTQEYCNYLAEKFNVEFVFEKTDYNDDAQISCVENLISTGCKAIISAYDTSLESAIQTCESAGVYYVLALDYASPADASNVNSKYFLGGTKQFGGDEAALGEAYAQAFLKSGLTNVSGVSFPAFAFVEATPIYQAFKDTVTAAGDNTVSDLVYSSGFASADVQTATASAISQDTQAIFGLASGLDYVYPELTNNHPDVKLLALGYNSSVGSLFDAGSLIAAGTNNYPQSIASCFVRIMNALDGKSFSDADAGAYNQKDGDVNVVNGVASYPVFTDKESLADFETYALGRGTDGMAKGAVTADEIKSVLLSENANATLADLNTLTNRTVDEIKAAR
jgi:ABC-type sugar transport system substrate-binding protein